jgi:hypothetical protein
MIAGGGEATATFANGLTVAAGAREASAAVAAGAGSVVAGVCAGARSGLDDSSAENDDSIVGRTGEAAVAALAKSSLRRYAINGSSGALAVVGSACAGKAYRFSAGIDWPSLAAATPRLSANPPKIERMVHTDSDFNSHEESMASNHLAD